METTTAASTTSTVMAPLLADKIYQKLWGSSTTPCPGPGGRTLTMMADVSEGAIFHSCARMETLRRRKRTLPLFIGGLITVTISGLDCYFKITKALFEMKMCHLVV